MAQRVGIYAGSFDPFHKGHKGLLEDAATAFEKIIVLIACNESKKIRHTPASEALRQITAFIRDRDGFDAGFMGEGASPGQVAAQLNACLIRGIRDITDMDYERRLATFNRELFGVQTVFIMSRPELAHINSTAIRELIYLGLDYQRYL